MALSDNQPNLLSRLAHDVNITVRDNDQGKQYDENSCYCPQFWGVRRVSNNKPRRGKNEGKHPDEKYATDTPCNRHNMSVLEDELDGYIALDSHSTHCESCCYDCLYPEPMFSHTKGVGVAFNPQKEYSDIYWVHGKPYKEVGGTERTEKVVGHCSQSWSGINSIQHGALPITASKPDNILRMGRIVYDVCMKIVSQCSVELDFILVVLGVKEKRYQTESRIQTSALLHFFS